MFGMDAKGPTAKPEEVEDYLRNLGAKDWGASLDVAVMPRKKPKKVRSAANDTEPEPNPCRRSIGPRRPPSRRPRPSSISARPKRTTQRR